MLTINRHVYVDDVSKCLDDFANFINAKLYYSVKVEYKIWRKLSKALMIELDFESMNKVYIHAVQPDETIFTTIFATNDNGFGQYLFDYYYEKETAKVNTSLNVGSIDETTTNKLNTYDVYNNISYNNYATSGDAILQWRTTESKVENKKEENNMNTNKMFNFDFGPCDDTIRMSMYGLAVKNQAGEWVSYDSNNSEIVNVEVFNIAEGGKWFYKMPVSVDSVAVGDLLIHAKRPCYVVDFNENTLNPIVIDIFNMERKEILLQKNMFGFNFATKVISLFDGFGGEKPSAENPFGNMLPFLLMSGGGKNDDMLPFILMRQIGGENTQLCGSPLMMYLMVKDHADSDMLPLMLMMNQQKK